MDFRYFTIRRDGLGPKFSPETMEEAAEGLCGSYLNPSDI